MVLKRGPRKPPVERDLAKLLDQSVKVSDSTFRVYTNRRRRGFLNTGSAEHASKVVQLVLTLQRNGIYVPRIQSVDYRHGIIHFEKGGKTLSGLHKISPDFARGVQREMAVQRYWFKAARMIGTMHKLGISHFHPHPKNIIVKGNRVGLIDFKFARKNDSVRWNSVDAYFEDCLQFINWAPPRLRKKLLERIVAQYPCTPEMKRKLLESVRFD